MEGAGVSAVIHLTARTVFEGHGGTVVEVLGKCTYQLVFHADEVHVKALGIDRWIDVDPEHYPMEEPEAAACMIVAQLEGGIEL